MVTRDRRQPLNPFFFNFMQFLGTNDQNNRLGPPLGLAPPSGKS